MTPTCAASSTAPRSPTSPPSSRTGSPHSTPVYVGTHGDRVVFFTGPGSKARNLHRDPRMALSIAPDRGFRRASHGGCAQLADRLRASPGGRHR
ncbi:pyridoxamine 5'-phosphate oxidase family protein [Dactylosporangium sp. NPDC000555]|uniref:pyridoxamine 5'-phosphate oxidase family protein n=1 Tax=Dactylosporangium sp. NPDC000555 TaxID=3154260 RepID=UPI0033176B6E